MEERGFEPKDIGTSRRGSLQKKAQCGPPSLLGPRQQQSKNYFNEILICDFECM